jgi:hypothetical protein
VRSCTVSPPACRSRCGRRRVAIRR